MSPFKSKLIGSTSLGSIGFILVLAFYVAWPLYAGYAIKTALDRSDSPGLTARIDFDSVRTSLRPVVAIKVDKVITETLNRAGGAAGTAFADKIKAQVMPRIVDGVLATLVTPEMLIRIHASGKTLKETLDGLVVDRASKAEGLGGFLIAPPGQDGKKSKLEEMAGKLGIDTKKVFGGLSGETDPSPPSAETTEVLPAKSEPKPRYGIGNIKRFSLSGPLDLTVGVARDAAARTPDLTVEMTFKDGGWMLTGLVPKM